MHLRGWPLRSGTAIGVVRVLTGPEEGGPRDVADVLVGPARFTLPRAVAREGVAVVLTEAELPSSSEGDSVGVPVVGGLDPALFRDGDRIRLDGDSGGIDLPEVQQVEVVTVFLQRPDGRVLLLLRSDAVGSFQGRWAAVSGFLEEAPPIEQARKEVLEEVGLDLARQWPDAVGHLVYAREGARMFEVHPFRFRTGAFDVRLDWEHTAFDWVEPAELLRRDTVPQLDRAWAQVADRP